MDWEGSWLGQCFREAGDDVERALRCLEMLEGCKGMLVG